VEIRFYLNPRTGEPHILDHGLTEIEVQDVLDGPAEIRPARDGAMSALGRTRNGRLLRVIYRFETTTDSYLVITAFEPGPAAARAFRRRQRRK
jgi:hypothetical protein